MVTIYILYTLKLKLLLLKLDCFRAKQERNEVRWRPGQEISLVSPCSKMNSIGSKCAFEESTCGNFRHPRSSSAPVNCAPLPLLVYAPGAKKRSSFKSLFYYTIMP